MQEIRNISYSSELFRTVLKPMSCSIIVQSVLSYFFLDDNKAVTKLIIAVSLASNGKWKINNYLC